MVKTTYSPAKTIEVIPPINKGILPFNVAQFKNQDWRTLYNNSINYNARDALKYTDRVSFVGLDESNIEEIIQPVKDCSTGLSCANVTKVGNGFSSYQDKDMQNQDLTYVLSKEGQAYFRRKDMPQGYFIKSNGDVQQDMIEFRLYNKMSDRGILVPEPDIDAKGNLIIKNLGDDSLEEKVSDMSNFSVDNKEALKEIYSLTKAAISGIAKVNHYANTDLSESEKKYADSLGKKKLAEKFCIDTETADKEYFSLRLFEALPFASQETFSQYKVLANDLDQSKMARKIFNTDRNPRNMFINNTMEGHENLTHIDFNSNRYDNVQLPLCQLLDAFLPTKSLGSNIHDYSSIFNAAAEIIAGDKHPELTRMKREDAIKVLRDEFEGSRNEFYDIMIDRYISEMNSLDPNGPITKEEFMEHWHPTRIYHAVRKAHSSLKAMAEAKDYQSIYFRSFEIKHHLDTIEEATLGWGKMKGDAFAFSSMAKDIRQRFISAVNYVLPEEVQRDTTAWIYSDIHHFRRK